MDQDTLVSEKIVKTGAEFLKRFGERFPITMAFWFKPEGAWDWRLHIISEAIDDSNSTDAQREGLRISDQMTYEGFDPFTVRLIPSHDRIAKAGIEAEHLSRGLPARHLRIHALAGFPLDDAYIYPMPSPEPVEQN